MPPHEAKGALDRGLAQRPHASSPLALAALPASRHRRDPLSLTTALPSLRRSAHFALATVLASLHAACTSYVADCGPAAAPCLLDLQCCPRVFDADEHGAALDIAPVRAGALGIYVMTDKILYTLAEEAESAEPIAGFEGPETSARLASTESAVYVTSRDRGTVHRIETGGDIDVFAQVERCPAAIAPAEPQGRVLWVATCLTDSPEPETTVRKHDLNTGVHESLPDTVGAADIVHDGTHVYWSRPEARTIVQASPSGDSRMDFLPNTEFLTPSHLAVDSENVYFVSEGSIMRLARESLTGDARTVAAGQGIPTRLVAASPALLVWITADGGDDGLGQVVRSDAEGETSVVASARAKLGGVAISGGHIYWVDGGAVYRTGE